MPAEIFFVEINSCASAITRPKGKKKREDALNPPDDPLLSARESKRNKSEIKVK